MLKLDNDQCLALLQTILNRSITGYALVGEDGKFWFANPTFCRIVEFTEAELKARRFQDITDPDDVAADTEMARAVAEGEYDSYDMTKAYITKTKKHQLVLLRVTGLRMSGKFICFVSEIAPVDKPQPQPTSTLEELARRRLFLKFLKDYWAQILFMLGSLAYVIQQAMKHT